MTRNLNVKSRKERSVTPNPLAVTDATDDRKRTVKTKSTTPIPVPQIDTAQSPAEASAGDRRIEARSEAGKKRKLNKDRILDDTSHIVYASPPPDSRADSDQILGFDKEAQEDPAGTEAQSKLPPPLPLPKANTLANKSAPSTKLVEESPGNLDLPLSPAGISPCGRHIGPPIPEINITLPSSPHSSRHPDTSATSRDFSAELESAIQWLKSFESGSDVNAASTAKFVLKQLLQLQQIGLIITTAERQVVAQTRTSSGPSKIVGGDVLQGKRVAVVSSGEGEVLISEGSKVAESHELLQDELKMLKRELAYEKVRGNQLQRECEALSVIAEARETRLSHLELNLRRDQLEKSKKSSS